MSVELGSVRVLGADAVGQPGQRRFRLFVQTARGSAIMWMEKEQLNSLSLTLDRFLAYLTEGQILRTEARVGEQPMPGKMPADFPEIPSYEFQVGQMKLSYDEENTAFMLSVIAQELSRAITAVTSAGRPVCPLCGAPLDGAPHACVKQNGHREILQIETSEEEDEEE